MSKELTIIWNQYIESRGFVVKTAKITERIHKFHEKIGLGSEDIEKIDCIISDLVYHSEKQCFEDGFRKATKLWKEC